MDLYIDDGYTLTRTVPETPGLLPELRIKYRQALARVRLEHRAALDTKDAELITKRENELFKRYVVTVNEAALKESELHRLKPALRAVLIDLILGYAGADEEADAKNS